MVSLPDPNSESIPIDNIQCPVCIEKIGGYLLECGHGVCPTCLEGINTTSTQAHSVFKCPLCRAEIAKKPVFIQAFSDRFDIQIIRDMNEKINIWWNNNQSTSTSRYSDMETSQMIRSRANNRANYYEQSIYNNLNNINPVVLQRPHIQNLSASALSFSAKEEYLTDRNNELGEVVGPLNLSPSSYFTLSNRNVQLSNGWTFTPFEYPIKIQLQNTKCYERSLNFQEHRRIITEIIQDEVCNTVQKIEQAAKSKFGTYNLFTEIRYRRENSSRRLTLGTYSGRWTHPNINDMRQSPNINLDTVEYITNLKIVCFGAWTYNNYVGCRWHLF